LITFLVEKGPAHYPNIFILKHWTSHNNIPTMATYKENAQIKHKHSTVKGKHVNYKNIYNYEHMVNYS